MNNKTKHHIYIVSVFVFFFVAGFSIRLIPTLLERKPSSDRYVFVINMHAFVGNKSGQPLQPSGGGVDIWTLIATVTCLITIASWVTGWLERFFKWLWWKTKYGKSRTPIVLPTHLKE